MKDKGKLKIVVRNCQELCGDCGIPVETRGVPGSPETFWVCPKCGRTRRQVVFWDTERTYQTWRES